MIKVYRITHRYDKKSIDSEILIGFFTSLEKCHMVIQHYRTLMGFKDYKNCFKIKSYWVSNMAIKHNAVYKVDYYWDETMSVDCNNAIYCGLGVYAKQKNAIKMAMWSSKILVYLLKKGEVICEKYVLDKCDWPEGFTIVP